MERISENVVRMSVEKKQKATGVVGNIVYFTLGLLLALSGIISSITIIGAIFGVPMFMFGVGLILISLGKQNVNCPVCEKKFLAIHRKSEETCPRCKTVVIIDWIGRKEKKTKAAE